MPAVALTCLRAASGLFGVGLAASAAAQVQFPVQFGPSAAVLTQEERDRLTEHFEEAGRRWAEWLVVAGPRSIEIEIGVDNTRPRAHGRSETSAFVAVVEGRNTFEQATAAELRTGVDPNGATADLLVNFNTTYLRDELWFDPDPAARSEPVPTDRTDAMSVALHEIGHGLAYNGWANGQGIPPLDFWSVFDRWMQPGAPTRFRGPQSLLQFGGAPDLTTDNIHHWANVDALPGSAATTQSRQPAAIGFRDGVPLPGVACDGPLSIDAPASLDAWPDVVRGPAFAGNLPPGLVYELMNGVAFFRGSRYHVSALDVAVLEDVGIAVVPVRVFEDGFETP